MSRYSEIKKTAKADAKNIAAEAFANLDKAQWVDAAKANADARVAKAMGRVAERLGTRADA